MTRNAQAKHPQKYLELKMLLFFSLMLSSFYATATSNEDRCHGYCFTQLVSQGTQGYEYLAQECSTCTEKTILCSGIHATPGNCKNCQTTASCTGIDLPADCTVLLKPQTENEESIVVGP